LSLNDAALKSQMARLSLKDYATHQVECIASRMPSDENEKNMDQPLFGHAALP